MSDEFFGAFAIPSHSVYLLNIDGSNKKKYNVLCYNIAKYDADRRDHYADQRDIMQNRGSYSDC